MRIWRANEATHAPPLLPLGRLLLLLLHVLSAGEGGCFGGLRSCRWRSAVPQPSSTLPSHASAPAQHVYIHTPSPHPTGRPTPPRQAQLAHQLLRAQARVLAPAVARARAQRRRRHDRRRAKPPAALFRGAGAWGRGRAGVAVGGGAGRRRGRGAPWQVRVGQQHSRPAGSGTGASAQGCRQAARCRLLGPQMTAAPPASSPSPTGLRMTRRSPIPPPPNTHAHPPAHPHTMCLCCLACVAALGELLCAGAPPPCCTSTAWQAPSPHINLQPPRTHAHTPTRTPPPPLTPTHTHRVLPACRMSHIHRSSQVRHVLHDHRMAALLVMNKCDLVPAAAADEWRAYFEARYPGLQVGGEGCCVRMRACAHARVCMCARARVRACARGSVPRAAVAPHRRLASPCCWCSCRARCAGSWCG